MKVERSLRERLKMFAGLPELGISNGEDLKETLTNCTEPLKAIDQFQVRSLQTCTCPVCLTFLHFSSDALDIKHLTLVLQSSSLFIMGGSKVWHRFRCDSSFDNLWRCILLYTTIAIYNNFVRICMLCPF